METALYLLFFVVCLGVWALSHMISALDEIKRTVARMDARDAKRARIEDPDY